MTDVWIHKQLQILPKTKWQHITFTMPKPLWDLFWLNRELLNYIGKLAADCIKRFAYNRSQVIPGIFIAIHTFGRDLKRNVHIHISTTTGGLTSNHSTWKSVYFDQNSLMRMWRYAMITLLRQQHKNQNLILSEEIKAQIGSSTFAAFLNRLYQKTWIVDCAKPSDDFEHNVNYLGRYVKRPPIAESKLKHYDGNTVTFKYFDHKKEQFNNKGQSVEEFIGRFIQHIPDVGFRMIRYYGFLANRVRGTLLPIVYTLLGQQNRIQKGAPTFVQMMQLNFNFNPLICILCNSQMRLAGNYYGIYSGVRLAMYHRELALLKKC